MTVTRTVKFKLQLQLQEQLEVDAALGVQASTIPPRVTVPLHVAMTMRMRTTPTLAKCIWALMLLAESRMRRNTMSHVASLTISMRSVQ